MVSLLSTFLMLCHYHFSISGCTWYLPQLLRAGRTCQMKEALQQSQILTRICKLAGCCELARGILSTLLFHLAQDETLLRHRSKEMEGSVSSDLFADRYECRVFIPEGVFIRSPFGRSSQLPLNSSTPTPSPHCTRPRLTSRYTTPPQSPHPLFSSPPAIP